jgi:RNA polymerase sigma-70 factor (ECF subfamily)
MNVEECFKELQNGNIQALKILYEDLRTPIYSIILSIVADKSIAEDLLQETFLRVYSKAYQYKPNTNAKAWVITIARNLAYDSVRNNKILKEDINDLNEQELIPFHPVVSVREDIVIDKLELTKALLKLEKTEREIVVMHVIAGFKHFEIAETLGVPSSTVRWKYRIAIKKLTELVGGNYYYG